MTMHRRADLKSVKTVSITKRKSKVSPEDFAKPFDELNDSFSSFTGGLPDILAAKDLRAITEAILRSRRRKKPVC